MYIALRRLRPKMTIFGFAIILSCWWNFGFCDLFDMENHTRGQILELFSRYLLNTMSLQTYHRLLSTVGGIMTDWFVRIVFIVNLMHGQSVSTDSCIPLRFCIPHSTNVKVRAAQYWENICSSTEHKANYQKASKQFISSGLQHTENAFTTHFCVPIHQLRTILYKYSIWES